MITDKIGIASDHAGFELKEHVISFLKAKGLTVKDFGCFSEESCDYPDFVHPLGNAIESKEFEFGIGICGSGQGVSITLNKHQQVRAALCWCEEIAELARKHNNANVLTMPARFISKEKAEEIVTTFLSTEFEGGRHLKRINKIPIQKIQ